MAKLYDPESPHSISPEHTVTLPEVEFLRGCAWYKAFLVDFEIEGEQAFIRLGDNLSPTCQIPLSHLRSSPSPSSDPITFVKKGFVEALAPAGEGEPEGWWKGKIAKMKGTLYVVEFESAGALFENIYERSKLRLLNSNKPFSKTNFPFYRTAIKVPSDLKSFCSKYVHESFKAQIGALSVSYRRDLNIIVVLAKSHSVIQRANLLSDTYIRNLRKQRESDRTNRKQFHTKVSPEKPELKRIETETETNVTNTISMGGILKIELCEDICTLCITGESEEGIEETKKRLKLVNLTINVPRKSFSEFMRKNGSFNASKSIAYKNGVVKVEIEDDTTQPCKQLIPENEVPVHFIRYRDHQRVV